MQPFCYMRCPGAIDDHFAIEARLCNASLHHLCTAYHMLAGCACHQVQAAGNQQVGALYDSIQAAWSRMGL